MKTVAIALGTVMAAAAASASAQVYYRSYDPYYAPRYESNQECWNPRAGHFEQLRPGEYQGDLDMSRCRMIGVNDGYSRYEYRGYGVAREECWNPRARHYEEVRRGEIQNDLDYSRCRVYR
jgi:hypothetical protein